MSTAAPQPTTTAWPATAAARGAPPARGAALANGPLALGAAGGDDAFAKALQRSRDAARADSARDAQRERNREREPEPAPPVRMAVPAPAPQAPRAAPPDTAGASTGAAAPGQDTAGETRAAGTDGSGPGASPAAGSDAAAQADRQRRAATAAAGKPHPGNTAPEAEDQDPAICLAPEDTDARGAAEGTDGATPADLAALLLPTAAAAAAAAALRAGQGAGAEAPLAEATAQAGGGASGTVPAPGDATGGAGKRAQVLDLRQRLARAAAVGARDDAGPAGGPTAAQADLAGMPRADAAQPGAHAALHGPAHAAAGLATAGVAAEAAPGTARLGAVAAEGAAAAAPGSTAGQAAAVQGADLRAAEPFALPAKPAAGSAPEATLWARPGSTDFAPQLGAQLAVWVRDGVHEARLQLNPADMGPVRVDIQLDGSAAQVSLTASNDQTRQALQDALPGLAGSLRDAGFTLAGGGVFDQAPQQRDGGDRATGSGRAPAADRAGTASAGTGATVLQPRRRGLVDLVA